MESTVTATCFCHSFTLTLSYPTSSLPHPRSLCLCTSCRTVSGTSGGLSYIPLPSSQQPPKAPPSLTNLTPYMTSERVTRYFCSTCGAHVLVHDSGKWAIATGVLEGTEGFVRWEGCKFVEGTLDGGVAPWFKEIEEGGGRRKLVSWMGPDVGGSETAPEGWNVVSKSQSHLLPSGSGKEEERLQAQCHCGGIKFYVTRPNHLSKKAKSPFSDLIIPFHTGASSANPGNDPWFLRCNNSKYLAGTCTCVSCRQTLGFEIQTWAFIPKVNIFQENGKCVDFETMGTLKRYGSSKEVWRNFCGGCGATVFWNAEWRPELVDVSVGLFDPKEGARVESWLEWWTERVSFEECAVSTSLVRSLKEGLREWGEKKVQS